MSSDPIKPEDDAAKNADVEPAAEDAPDAKDGEAEEAGKKSAWAKDAEDPEVIAEAAASAATLEAELADIKDQLLRALAETENVRRRAQKEKEDIGRFAISNFARDMLGVADNLHRAIEAIPEAVLSEDHELNGLYRGVELVERDLQQGFERHGIVKITPLGEKFDHNFHQAMFEVEDPDAAPGTVVQLMAPGYVIHGRLLRPAMVGIAKAGVKKDAGAADADAEDGDGAHAAKDTTADDPAATDGTASRR
jgi:molecular chaperone GrpE